MKRCYSARFETEILFVADDELSQSEIHHLGADFIKDDLDWNTPTPYDIDISLAGTLPDGWDESTEVFMEDENEKMTANDAILLNRVVKPVESKAQTKLFQELETTKK